MDVGVVVLVVAAQGVDDRARLLRGGRVVEVDQRLAVDLLLQDREVVADAAHVERGRPRPGGSAGDSGDGRDAHTRLLGRLSRAARASSSFFQLVAQRLDLDAADDVVGEGEGQQAAGLLQADAARAQVEDSDSASSWPTVAPCVHFTSSAKISSCGLVLMVASSESSRVLLVCLASVFWASWRTKILPLKTPCALPSRMPLYSSWLAQCGLAWSMTRVVVDQLLAVADGRGR